MLLYGKLTKFGIQYLAQGNAKIFEEIFQIRPLYHILSKKKTDQNLALLCKLIYL